MAKAKTTKATPAKTAQPTATEHPTASAPAPVRGGVVPYLQVGDAAAAADFYVKAFGAEEVTRMPPDEKGRTMHIHLYVNGNSVMLSDAFPEHGFPLQTPQAFTLHMMVRDVDASYERAVAAGAKGAQPPRDEFWGDRYAEVIDPYGVHWSLGAPLAK